VSAETVLVTGASGFIGSRLAERLVGEGRRVRCLVRASSDTARLSVLGVELAAGDLTDAASLTDAVQGVGRVFHCAAMVSDWGTVQEIARVNVGGTRNLLEAARAASVERFVHLSSTDVYGYPGAAAVEESHRAVRFANWYAQTKLEAEAEVERAHAPGELETVILRPATVYGPGSVDVIGEIARAIRGRHMLLVGGGRAIAGLCYVENLIDAALLASERELAAGEAINVCDGLAVTWRQFAGDLAAGLGARRPWLSLPYRPALALGLAFEQGYRGLRRATGVSSPALLSRQAVQVLGVDQDFSNRKAQELLGWEPRTSYEDGLAATLAWLSEEYFGDG
jgi:nucleoside-diphosphate-sugar epimerase